MLELRLSQEAQLSDFLKASHGGLSSQHASASATAIAEHETMLAASANYDAKYQRLMMQMQRPESGDRPRPFLGFSLAEDVEDRNLVIDGVYREGPAYQVGIRVDDELLSIGGAAVSSVVEARRAVGEHCFPGHVCEVALRRQNGEVYHASLWVMTSEPRYRGKSFFFDASAHEKETSPRRKKKSTVPS